MYSNGDLYQPLQPQVTQQQEDDSPLLVPPSFAVFHPPQTEVEQYIQPLQIETTPTQLAPNLPLTQMHSTSGFDIVSALVKMATRPNPKITLGPVDLSCAFVVSDLSAPDMPIVYVSPTFEEMTGFDNSEILGKNCRFLQHPTQEVFPGMHRTYTDNLVVQRLKATVDQRGEGQFTLVNYKKNGEPFLNHLTLIPIKLNGGTEFSHYIGLQIDLIAQPQAIMKRLQNGTYCVNYQQDRTVSMPEIMDDNLNEVHSSSSGTSTRSTVSPNFVEKMPDFIHVLSLRGLFLHVCPVSCKKLLEYQADEIIGHKISEFVHPSDLITVMRDLRNCSAEGSVNFICRMKRKKSGYIYMEMNGHVYSGSKRNRCFIITARERPLLNLPQNSFYIPELIQENETWIKTSPEGLIMFATATAATFFGYPFESLICKSLFELMNPSDHFALLGALACNTAESFCANLIGTDYECLFRCLPTGDVKGNTRWIQIKKGRPAVKLAKDDTNLFAIIQGVRSSSIYYESNKIRVKNTGLLEEISSQLRN